MVFGWVRNSCPGIKPEQRKEKMEKQEVIERIQDILNKMDEALGNQEKTDLLKVIQENHPDETIDSLEQVHIEYYRELLKNIIRHSKSEIKKAGNV